MWFRWLLITALVIVGGLMVLGLPGAVLFTLSRPVLALFYGRGFMERLPGDSAWPLAIGLTVLWPLGLWPLYLLVGRLLPELTGWGKVGAYAGLLYLWGALLSAVLYHFSRK
ncbi:MAG: hypothetical protein K0R39_4516, partial [Symbiobacteriaceae bacterium]|nr:hypothetical protein [Symbiobacteriaceae bacterium]